MENKYYTPTIEEFHVGFEYETEETFWHHTPPVHTGKWNKDVYEMGRAIEALLFVEAIRVKYLDKKDVEELGWTILNDTSGFIYKNNRTTYLSKLPDGSFLIQWGAGENPGMFTHVVFKGIIKNKSRLKLLMDMLEIPKLDVA